MTVQALEVVASEASERQAASLIRRGRVKDPGEWEPPTPERENDIIETKGWEVYGRWFLGREENAEPETKARYKYPYSGDFANVDRRGLVAIRQRAGQTKETQIFEAAGRLLDMLEEAEPVAARGAFRVEFKRRKPLKVDATKGTITEVSLMQLGEAKGHGIYIDAASLDSALVALGSGNLRAYVTHAGAVESDRLLNEVGVFSGFYVAEGKLKAKQFRALGSFMQDDPARFRRLFDLAEAAPDAFGVSLVFDADLVWVNRDGTETLIAEGSDENAVRRLPSVRFKSISSADFVDAPAANDDGLFTSKPNEPRTLRDVVREEIANRDKSMSTKETKQDELILEEPAPEEIEEPEQPEEPEAQVVEDENEASELEELKAQVDALTAENAELTSQIAELTESRAASEEKVAKLSALVEGVEALAEHASPEETATSIVDRFNSTEGAEQNLIWKQNRREILASLRGAK